MAELLAYLRDIFSSIVEMLKTALGMNPLG